MNRTMIMVALAALGLGWAGGYLLSPTGSESTQVGDEAGSAQREVLYWRNPMNPEITSPVFTQDEMGMDYIPVYAEEPKPEKEREVLYWRNPMNPEITSPVFTQDEMGMDYIPVYADGGSGSDAPAGTVTIDPTVVQNIGVRTAKVEQRTLARQIRALGHVDFNEERLARLHPKTSGWIEQLRIEETGTAVKRNTILLSIYAPELVSAQQEYLVALNNWEAVRNSSVASVKNSAKRVLESARDRLELFDVPAHQIHELEQSRELMRNLHIHSPFAGRVMNIGVREGQYVTPKDELYLIADLSRIWVYVDVYEDDLPWIEVGDRARLEVRAAPGRVFEGEVSFIRPVQDRQTRTVRVRLAVDNPDLVLKPGMFANVTLFADPRPEAVVVPTEAIVRSGQREQVFVARGEGKFVPREVRLGISAGGVTQILSGVQPGERVVVSSQFLIDSESKLKEATAKMMAPKEAPMEHDMSMEEMDMGDTGMEDMSMEDMSMDDLDMSETGD